MWQAIQVRMRLAAPLAVGPGWRLGFVMLTRLDVPPRTLWGAFTDALTRWSLSCPGEEPSLVPKDFSGEINAAYEAAKSWVAGNLRFLPGLFAIGEEAGACETFVPDYEFGEGEIFRIVGRDGTVLCKVTSQQLKEKLVHGHASTALSSDSMAAEDAMLHETERVMPYAYGPGKEGALPVWLGTVVWAKPGETAKIISWLHNHAVKYLRIGRDVSLGDGVFAEIKAEEIDAEGLCRSRLLNNGQSVCWKTDQQAGPILEIKTENDGPARLAGPLLIHREHVAKVAGYWGTLRPHLVREFDKAFGFGRRVGPPGGSVCMVLEYGGLVCLKENGVYQYCLKRDGLVLV